MLPNPAILLEKLEITHPLIGLYEVPGIEGLGPMVEPEAGKNLCLFKFYRDWFEGKTLHLTREKSGCGGCTYWLFAKETRDRDDFVAFLADTEGLKDSKELMNRWLDHVKPYKPKHEHLLVGRLEDNEASAEYLKTVTFFATPDQLSALVIGAQYYCAPDDPLDPVIAPFGSGCMQMLSLFKDLDYPQAVIGSTDIAMRNALPPEIITFTVTVPMFRQLCQLDERSFLFKPFLRTLKKARGDKGIGRV